MRFLTAFFLCFSISLLWTACEKDDDLPLVTTIDCSTINTSDTSICMALNTNDSLSYVRSFLGSWYLAASQNSGFGGGSTECINYTEAESPYKFTFNEDYTWRLIDTEANVDTILGWTVVNGFGGFRVSSNTSEYPTPELAHLCDEDLVTDSRPVDGPLRIYKKAN